MMRKVRPVPATPASPPSVPCSPWYLTRSGWSVVPNCYTIEGPAVSPGSSLLYKSISSGQGGRGEAAPHTGDVLTTDLSQIATQPWEQSGLWARGIRNATSPHNISYYLPDRVLRCNAVYDDETSYK